MRGVPLFGFPSFDAASRHLVSLGHEPVSPADLDRQSGFDPAQLPINWDWSTLPDGFDLKTAMDRDKAAIDTCRAIVLLNRWEESEGAREELHYAVSRDKPLSVWLYNGGAVREAERDEWLPVIQRWAHEQKEKTRDKPRRWMDANLQADLRGGHGAIRLPPIPTLENPKDIAGSVKPPLALIPHGPECEVAQVMACGRDKYGAWNWRDKRPTISAYLSAMRRHVGAYGDGEDNDPDSGLSHLAHAAATLLIIMDAIEQGTAIDDRPGRTPPCA